ncbi:MAG: hypothetical protein LBL21_01705 [Rickettsiales bacterium]|jgi:hypothetical protein|nr:hypothetical protein [Rickettsiales bacterium]
MKNKRKIADAATCCAVGFHFICCGLPLVVALGGGTLSFSGLVGGTAKTALLAVSAAMLAVSWLYYFRNKCGRGKWKLVLLASASLLFMGTTAAHFGGIEQTMGAPACH